MISNKKTAIINHCKIFSRLFSKILFIYLNGILDIMLEKNWLLFLTAGIGLIIIEHTTLGIVLSFIGFALARHKEEYVYTEAGYENQTVYTETGYENQTVTAV